MSSLPERITRLLVPAQVKQPPVPYSGVSVPLWGVAGYGKPEAYIKAYGEIGWLFAVVSRIGFSVGEAEWKLYRETRDGPQEVLNNPLWSLWNNPNPFYTAQDLLELSQIYLDLTGEAFWIMNLTRGRRPAEIWVVPPHAMRIVPSEADYIAGYVYQRGTRRVPFEVDEVIHFRYPNPADMYRGLGPVQPIAVDLDTEAYSAKYNRNFFLNSARPDAVLESERPLGDEQFQRLKQEWAMGHQGVERAHRVGILEEGLTYKQISLSQQDMAFIDQRKLNRDAIIGAYGVPLSILGITESVNRANAEAGEYTYAQHVISPRLQRIRRALNKWLAPRFGQGLTFDFDDPTPEDREANRLEAESGVGTGYLMVDEGRELMGHDPLPDNKGQIFLWGLAVTPQFLDELGEEPEEPEIPPQLLPPVMPEEEPPEEEPAEEQAKRKAVSVEAKDRMAELFVKRLEPGERAYQNMLHAYWLGQKKRLATRVRRLGHGAKAVTLADEFWAELADDVWWDIEAQRLAKASEPILLALLAQAAAAMAEDYGLEVTLDIASPRIGEWLGYRLRKYSTAVTETTKDIMIRELREAAESAESVEDMVKRMQAKFPEMEKYRLERIARTEVVAGSNVAAMEVAREGGLRYKQWWAAMDERTRDWHAAVHGTVLPMDEKFAVGPDMMSGPGDLEASAENVINCRCSLLFLNDLEEAVI